MNTLKEIVVVVGMAALCAAVAAVNVWLTLPRMDAAGRIASAPAPRTPTTEPVPAAPVETEAARHARWGVVIVSPAPNSFVDGQPRPGRADFVTVYGRYADGQVDPKDLTVSVTGGDAVTVAYPAEWVGTGWWRTFVQLVQTDTAYRIDVAVKGEVTSAVTVVRR